MLAVGGSTTWPPSPRTSTRGASLLALLRMVTSAGTLKNRCCPPLGVFEVNTFFPEKERFELAMSLNAILASPSFQSWTEGEPLDYEKIELPSLPLMERAREWGLSVKAVPGNYQYHGYFYQDKQEIGLASKDEAVFFHELAHAAHMRIVGDLKTVPPWEKEVVAELAAAALCKILGKDSNHLGTSYQYVRHYAEQEGLSPLKACLRVIGETEAILTAILQRPPPYPTRQCEQASPYKFAEQTEESFPQAQAAL